MATKHCTQILTSRHMTHPHTQATRNTPYVRCARTHAPVRGVIKPTRTPHHARTRTRARTHTPHTHTRARARIHWHIRTHTRSHLRIPLTTTMSMGCTHKRGHTYEVTNAVAHARHIYIILFMSHMLYIIQQLDFDCHRTITATCIRT